MAMFKVICYLFFKKSVYVDFFISKSNNIFVYLLEVEIGLENRNSIDVKENVKHELLM